MVSIIIVNWNGLQDTIECIDSILTSNATDYKIYLIDNNSSDNEYDELSTLYQKHPQIHLIDNHENLGFAKAHIEVWEKEIKTSETDNIVLINNDTTVEPDWLLHLTETAQTTGADIVSCKMINYTDRSIMDTAGHQIISTGEIIPIGHGRDVNLYNTQIDNAGACGGACLYSKKMLEEIGFFDPHFDTGYEDAELGIRAIAVGKKAIFCPESIIYHKGGEAIKKVFNEEYAINNQRNILYTFFKVFPLWQIILYYPIILIKAIVTIVLSLVFLKWNYASILCKAHIRFVNRDMSKALAARRQLYSKNNMYSSIKFYMNQKSFITFELGRLYSHLILRKPSALDKYR